MVPWKEFTHLHVVGRYSELLSRWVWAWKPHDLDVWELDVYSWHQHIFFVHLLAGWLACRTWEAPAAAKPIGSVMVTPSSTCLPWAWSYWMNILSSLGWHLAHLGTSQHPFCGLGWWSPMAWDGWVSPTNKALVWRAHPGVRQCEMASDESMTQVKQDPRSESWSSASAIVDCGEMPMKCAISGIISGTYWYIVHHRSP